jgi:hypothetical protein
MAHATRSGGNPVNADLSQDAQSFSFPERQIDRLIEKEQQE